MPRRVRLHLEGAFYHVMARGNRKQQIFHEERDYIIYLDLMQKYSQRFGVEVHGYALMPNHVHMLLRVGSIPIYKFMQGLQQSYTQYFNKKNKLVGHVFQGRYKDIFVDKDEYLLELIRYIHLNPVKDGLAGDPLKYRWSSHKAYFENNYNMLVHTYFLKELLAEYGGTVIDDYRLVPEAIARLETTPQREADTPPEATQRRHREAVIHHEATLQPEAITSKGKHALDNPGHIVLIRKQLGTKQLGTKQLDTERLNTKQLCRNSANRGPFDLNDLNELDELNELDSILKIACSTIDVNPDLVLLPGRQPKVVMAKKIFIYLACRQAGYRIGEVAGFLGCSDINISKSLKWYEERMLSNQIKGVRLKLNIITQ